MTSRINFPKARNGTNAPSSLTPMWKPPTPIMQTSRHSLPEESEALTAAAKVLEKLKADKKVAELAASDQSLSLLIRLLRGGLIEPYVLFSLGDAGIACDYAAYRTKNRKQLEEYMDKLVVPQAQ